MQNARKVASRHLSDQTELKIHETHGNNLDLYVQAVLTHIYGETEKDGALCKHCNQRTVTIQLVQTRSADEGMTAKATCTNPQCGKNWTVH